MERHAIADLLATARLPPVSYALSISRITASLGATLDELRSALEDLYGPWGNRAAEREARARERSGLWTWVVDETRRLGVAGYGERLRARGVGGEDIAVLRDRLAAAFLVIERLPAEGVPLAGLACDLLGDPHALDYGSRLSVLVLDAIAERNGIALPGNAEDARRLWALAGVSVDGLSSSVLCLGLEPPGDEPLAAFLRESATASEPVSITVAQLVRWPLRRCAPIVYAFENPSILVQAASLGWKGPPLVCTSGWPNVAAITLLRQLLAFGTCLRYHGDFDPSGLCIAQMLVDRIGVEPWRMTADDYEGAVGRARVPIVARVPDVAWDERLAVAMRSHGLAVFEEDLRGALLRDLAQA